jgi:glyoxylase-like metal-dependent hydrolase (beta-lactamase superfamily II)
MIHSNIFQIEVPLPLNPLRHLNSYLIKSEDRNLLIDTGLNYTMAFKSVCNDLAGVGVGIEDLTDILVTHFHVDHVGMIHRFTKASENVRVFIHKVEAELSKVISAESKDHTETVRNFLEVNGAPSSISLGLQKYHPAFNTPQAYIELATKAVPIEDGKEFSIDSYNFKVLWTPGHSPGHVCLHEPSLKVLVSGDHLLPTITPHVSQFMEDMKPLSDYLDSLIKTQRLDVEIVLPGHEKPFSNHKERIEQLKKHHKQRLGEIVDELKKGSSTAYSLASKIHWDINFKSWEEFPRFQKYLALGETIAHLNFLRQKGIVKKTLTNNLIFYDAD